VFPVTAYNIGVFITVKKKTCLPAHNTVFIIVQIIETLYVKFMKYIILLRGVLLCCTIC